MELGEQASFILLSKVVAVTVVVNPSVVDTIKNPRTRAAQHPEPVGVVHEQIGFAVLNPLIVARFELIDHSKMPSADPVGRPIAIQTVACGDHPAQINV